MGEDDRSKEIIEVLRRDREVNRRSREKYIEWEVEQVKRNPEWFRLQARLVEETLEALNKQRKSSLT